MHAIAGKAKLAAAILLSLGGLTSDLPAQAAESLDKTVLNKDRVLIGAYKLSYPDSTPLEKLQQEIDDLQSLGFDYAYFDVWGVPKTQALQPLLSYADQKRFLLAAHLNVCMSPLRIVDDQGKPQWKKTPPGAPLPPGAKPHIYGIGEETWAQRWRDGSVVYEGAWRGHPFPYPDMWSPAARQFFRQTTRDAAQLLASHPSVKLFSYDDEYRYWFDFVGDRGIPVFSPWSKQIIGLAPGSPDVPAGEPPAPGYVSGSNDAFAGVRYTTGYQFFDFTDPSLDFHVSDLSRVLNQESAGVHDFFTTGAYGGDTGWTMARAYATERNDPPLSDAFSLAFARRKAGGNGDTAVMIGWWLDHLNTPFYNRRLQLATRLTLMDGPRSIVFAPTNTLRSIPEYRASLQQAVAEIEQIGPLFRRIQLQQPRVAMLWSDTTLSYQQLGESNWKDKPAGDPARNWRWEEHKLAAHITYAALCQAGYRPRVITERDVLDGALREIDVLVLSNHQYSETRLVREYEAFVARKGLVIADKSSAVKITNARKLQADASQWCREMEKGNRDWWSRELAAHLKTYRTAQGLIDAMAKELRPILTTKLPADVSSETVGRVVTTKAQGAGAEYLVIVNSDLENAGSTRLKLEHTGVIYDLTSGGAQVDRSSLQASEGLKLDPADWRVLMLADRPLQTVKAVLVTGQSPAIIRCQLWDDEGYPMRGVVPIQVRVGDQIHHGVAEHGVGTLWLPHAVESGADLKVQALGMTAAVQMMPTGH